MDTQLSPYLNFNDNCREAMEFYKSVFGGELEINQFGDFPGDLSEEQKTKVMHATLKGGAVSFMASDGMPGVPVKFGDNINMSLAGTDEESLTKFFNALSEGGKIKAPLEKQVWGDKFGMLTDKFGVNWLVNISANESTAV